MSGIDPSQHVDPYCLQVLSSHGVALPEMLQWMLARVMPKHPARYRSIALSFSLDDVLIDDAWQGQPPNPLPHEA